MKKLFESVINEATDVPLRNLQAPKRARSESNTGDEEQQQPLRNRAAVRTRVDLDNGNLSPSSVPLDYYVHHMQPKGIFETHMNALIGPAQEHIRAKVIAAVRNQPYLVALTQNARMAALLAKHLCLFAFAIDGGQRCGEMGLSGAELQTAALFAAREFKNLNGLNTLQKDAIFTSLIRAMALHMVPYRNRLIEEDFDQAIRYLSGRLGLVTDRATWEASSSDGRDVYVRSSDGILTCPSGCSRYELTRGMLSILSLLVFGVMPERSRRGEETAAAMTVLLIVAALRDMPVEAMKRVLRYGMPLTPGSLGMEPAAGEVHLDDVCAAMQWEQPAPPQDRFTPHSLTHVRTNEEEKEFLDFVKQSSAIVAAALYHPNAEFADAVVGLKTHNDDDKKGVRDGRLVLIQSRDLNRDVPLYEFFCGCHRMGQRGAQGIAGYLAATAPLFFDPTNTTTVDCDALATLQLAMFEVAPSLNAAFQAHWNNVCARKDKKKQARAEATDQDRIDWLCSYDHIPCAEIFACLFEEAKFNRLKDKFTAKQWAALPFVAPCKKLKRLKAAYGAQDAMFVTYCASESVPLELRTSPRSKEVCIDWAKIRDEDIGIIFSDSRQLLCTLPSYQQSIFFQATVSSQKKI